MVGCLNFRRLFSMFFFVIVVVVFVTAVLRSALCDMNVVYHTFYEIEKSSLLYKMKKKTAVDVEIQIQNVLLRNNVVALRKTYFGCPKTFIQANEMIIFREFS